MGEHDQLFKRAFRVPEHAAAELVSVLPKAIAEALDRSSLELVQGDFVSQRLNERFTDALFSAKFRGIPGYVWLLLEHQSGPDRWMPLRVLEYFVRSWSELLRREPDREQLPPIVCVVVHHGEKRWTSPKRLQELIAGVSHLPELSALIPDFEIVVDDLPSQADDELLRRELKPFPKVVLWVLRDARTTHRLYEHLNTWAKELDRLSRQAPEDAATVMRYILAVAGDEPLDSIRRRVIQIVPTTEQPMASAAEQLIQQGKAESKVEDLLTVLAVRNLTPTEEQRKRILQCKDPSLLGRWLRLAVTANAVEEIFID